jgi:UDP-N-acetylglucosamine--N-acetylmuramyl-(pentapeptide) pyrophosphoryl-undecaprenol N-acetylglucosamine transferase
MTFLIAAAGTGGHVFPGLAVGEALLAQGTPKGSILYVGGDRLEKSVYPESGFPFLQVEVRGLQRSMTMRNLSLPRVVWRARAAIVAAIEEREVKVVLGMGGYVTIPAALAAKSSGSALLVAEQNAGGGLANRVASRWAARTFTSFPDTEGLERGEWVGNPVRGALSSMSREETKPEALSHYGLDPRYPVLGAVGGSLGAGVINGAVRDLVENWERSRIQVLHLTGEGGATLEQRASDSVLWVQRSFEKRMELFYAACDLVVARAGGGVAELTATSTPSILIPGEFGSSGHQAANAAFLNEAGAATVLTQDRLHLLPGLVAEILLSPDRLEAMRIGARSISKPDAAITIAGAMQEFVS